RGSGSARAFLRHHALDAGTESGTCGLHAGDFLAVSLFRLGTRRRRSRGHQLCCNSWLFGTALFQLFLLTLARALVLPVFEAISQRQNEGEARGRPEFDSGEREGGGQVER